MNNKAGRRNVHGESRNRTPEYRSWLAMLGRTRQKQYTERYMDRGIGVCDRWLDYVSFLADMGRKPSPRHTIERIDNNLGYSPSNCKWATYREQDNNRRNSKFVTYNGETKTVAMWARHLGMHRNSLLARLKIMSVEDAITKPRRSYSREQRKSARVVD